MLANGLFCSAPPACVWLGAPNSARMSSLLDVAGLAGAGAAAAAAGAAGVAGAEVKAENGSSKAAAGAVVAAGAGAEDGVSPNRPRISVGAG